MTDPVHITLRLAACWGLLNATAITFLALLFTLQESWAALLRRMRRPPRKLGIVIPFSRR